jgi:hypothetical protein
MRHVLLTLALAAALALGLAAQESAPGPTVPLQPLAQTVRRLETALAYLGQPLSAGDHDAIAAALSMEREVDAVAALQRVLDPHVLLTVHINPESRVKVEHGSAVPELVEEGTRLFLVKVLNEAGVRTPLVVRSPQSGATSVPSWSSNGSPEPPLVLSPKQAIEKWADISLYEKSPFSKPLTALGVEYRILQVFSRDSGRRAAQIAFNVGQGTEDVGFRNDVLVVFDAKPARDVRFSVTDADGRPGMASFIIRDRQGRLQPAASKRLAPDLPFQPQIYRGDGESLRLPDGRYDVLVSGGPEYIPIETTLDVGPARPATLDVRLERWIDPAARGWYSADHHVHAAGCSHYENPTIGVDPKDMSRQVRGEGLNIGSVLTWGPGYYHQKQFFSGRDDPSSTPGRLVHYDLEVSGFPSSHAGHLVLLGLEDQDYPGTKRIEDWPTWTLPVLQWAAKQGAVTGFAHSGWGLAVMDATVPSLQVPAYDGIGANEYIVDVTHEGAVNFISAVDTPYPWELTIWYHTLNVGFRTRISGETDFPCIFDDRVGRGRTYARMPGLSYGGLLDAVRRGASYVSDGRAHLLDFAVNGTPVGSGAGEVSVAAGQSVSATVTVAALLDPVPRNERRNTWNLGWSSELDPSDLARGIPIASRPVDEQPYWDIERARIGTTRRVPVELVVNGTVAGRAEIEADGAFHDVRFDTRLDRSSWIAVRILGAAHSNPVFALVGGAPIRASRASARWCLASVDQAWSQKAPQIRPTEIAAARSAWDHAREVYRQRLAESPVE